MATDYIVLSQAEPKWLPKEDESTTVKFSPLWYQIQNFHSKWLELQDTLHTRFLNATPCKKSIIATLTTITLLVVLVVASKHYENKPYLHDDFDNTLPYILNGSIPQMGKDDVYIDKMVALNTSDPFIPNNINTKDLKYAILLPTYTKHFGKVADLFHSLKCLCVDLDQIDINIIVSNVYEKLDLEEILSTLPECGPKFSRFDTPIKNINAPNPKANIVVLYDILPPSLKTDDISKKDTHPLLKKHRKYIYQSIKKLSAAIHFDYDYAIWLDSEAVAVRPFSIRNTIDTYVKNPTVWRSRMSKEKIQWNIMKDSASVLGRSIDSFGSLYWTLESVEWVIEKEIINDMIKWIEAAHDDDFWNIFISMGGPFEINLYYMHIQARKLETTNSIFSKYQVLETEREMIRFGMGPSFPLMEYKSGTGFLERGYKLLAHEGIQPNFSAFLRRYGQRLLRFDKLDVADPEVIDRFLLDTPIDLICSGAPKLHDWWIERLEKESKNITNS